jgi:hypothetical protein
MILNPWHQPWHQPWYKDWKNPTSNGFSPDDIPVNITPPSISGNEGTYHNHGVQVNRVSGVWIGADTLTGQWRKNGVDIAGETGAFYIIPNDWQEGDILTYRETATNIDLVTVYQDSNSLVAEPPSVLVDPVIAGDNDEVGDALTITNPGFISNGATVTRQWKRDVADIAGQTGSSYNLQSADYDELIYVRITGENSYGSTFTDSNGILAAFIPDNTVAPVIGGWTSGSPASVTTPPTWLFANTVTGQWRRNGSDVVGQTGTTYTGSYAIGDTLVYRSTAVNIYDTVIVDSNTMTILASFGLSDEGQITNASFAGGYKDLFSFADAGDITNTSFAGQYRDPHPLDDAGLITHTATGSYV